MAKMYLNADGTVNSIGDSPNFPYECPSFIATDPNPFLWKWDLVNDKALQSSWSKIPGPVKSTLQIIDGERAFCIEFTKTLFQRIREIDQLTNAQRITLLNNIQLGMNALQWGDVPVARAAFANIATTTLWTQGRKDWVLAQLDAFIALG